MRKSILILSMMAMGLALMTSCASYRGSERSGCKATQGMIGYGAR